MATPIVPLSRRLGAQAMSTSYPVLDRIIRRDPTYVVFISYHRSHGSKVGGDKVAQLFRRALEAKGLRSFMDVENFKSGPFDEGLFERIERTPNFLVILSPGSLDRNNGNKSWFQLEIAHALKTRRNIIPVMVDGFEFPPAGLPEEIRGLALQNALTYSDFY